MLAIHKHSCSLHPMDNNYMYLYLFFFLHKESIPSHDGCGSVLKDGAFYCLKEHHGCSCYLILKKYAETYYFLEAEKLALPQFRIIPPSWTWGKTHQEVAPSKLVPWKLNLNSTSKVENWNGTETNLRRNLLNPFN